MSQSSPPIQFGLTGLGGYAGYVCDRLLAESDPGGGKSARLVGVAEPEPERFPRRLKELGSRGIPVVREFADLLNQPIDAVWLPLPIHLHLPYTEMALRAGKGVICEKPAAGCVDDVDRMIAARDQNNGLPVAIGFQDVFQPAVAKLKGRMLAGEFGRPLGAQVIGCWPRSERYFGRNDWAGRMRRDGRWVMDSPASNALAHFLHLALFLLSSTPDGAAHTTEVSAELYRANPIENYDTCALRYRVDPGNIPLDVAFTHACNSSVEPVVAIEMEKAKIFYVANRHVEIRAGAGEEILPLSSNPHRHMLASFARSLRDGGNGVASTLEMARAHIVAVNAASEAAPVIEVPDKFITAQPAADQSTLRAIQDVIPALKSFISTRCHLHETGLAPWATQQPVSKLINGYTHFAGPANGDRASVQTFVADSSAAAARA